MGGITNERIQKYVSPTGLILFLFLFNIKICFVTFALLKEACIEDLWIFVNNYTDSLIGGRGVSVGQSSLRGAVTPCPL